MLKKDYLQLLRGRVALVLLLLVGSITWALVMVKSGLLYDFGYGFWGPNGHDGVWHLALANSLSRGSGLMPTFAGSALQNYHLGFDLTLAIIHKITTIPTRTLYFQIIPPILALLIGYLVYKFVLIWRGSKQAAFWAAFFVYFGGGFGWVVTLFREGSLGGESLFWSQQSISTLINPPFALSLLFMLLGLLALMKLDKKFTILTFLVASLLFGALIQIKAYAGLLSLGGLLVAGVFEFWKKRKTTAFRVFVGSLLVSILLFFPFSKGAAGLVVFKPFWFLETMMQFPDRVGWMRFGEAMVNYKSGNVLVKAVPAYIIAFIIFWYGNMGTRLIGEIWLAKRLKNLKEITSTEVFIYSIIGAGAVIPLFFLQKGTPWNTIQFFYYSLIFSGVLAGVALGEFLDSKKKVGTYVVGTITFLVLITIPTTYSTLKNHYLPSRPPAKLSVGEIEALDFLADQDNGIVLTFPFDKDAAQKALNNPPRPLYLYESTAYVSAFSNKPVFLEDEINLEITGYDWQTRRQEVEKLLLNNNQVLVDSFLKENNISYVYWLKGQGDIFDEGQAGVIKIFENSEAEVFKVD